MTSPHVYGSIVNAGTGPLHHLAVEGWLCRRMADPEAKVESGYVFTRETGRQ